MKKISITIILLVGMSYFVAKSQVTSTIDIILISQFDIIPNGVRASGPNTVLLDSIQFIQRFGKPETISYEKAEMDSSLLSHYTYKGAEIWYESNSLQDIDITSSDYVFKLSDGSATIKVGDNTKTLRRLFPNSWALREDGRVGVGLKNNGIEVDCGLIFKFNSSGRIISIIYSENNS